MVIAKTFIGLADARAVLILPNPECKQWHNHVTFVGKCPILCLAMYLLAPNNNKHDDIDVLHPCVSKWLNEMEQNENKCHL